MAECGSDVGEVYGDDAVGVLCGESCEVGGSHGHGVDGKL